MSSSPAFTLTGSFENLIGASTGYVNLQLIPEPGFGQNAPFRIAGTGMLAQTGYSTPVGSTFSVTVWGNDVISPAPTLYRITVYDSSGGAVFNSLYQLVGSGSQDLSTLTPWSQTANEPEPPSGQVGANLVYAGPSEGGLGSPTFRAEVVADLPTSGTWPFAGTLSGNPTFSGNPNFTGLPTVGNLNNFFYVGSEYSTLASAVAAANNAGGGTIYTATPETFSADPFAGLTEASPKIRVILGPGTWSTKVPISVPAETQLIGAGRSLTIIQTVSGYAQGSGRAACVFDVYGTVGTIISDMEIDAGNGATTGIYATDINENSGFQRLAIGNFSAYGIYVDAPAFWNEPAQTYFIRDVEAYCETAGISGTTFGIYLNGDGGGPALVQNVTANGASGHTLAASLVLANMTGGYVNSIHGEYATDVLQLGTSGFAVDAVTVANITGGNGSGTSVVHIQNSGSSALNVLGVQLGTFTNSILDAPRSVTLTDEYVGFYTVGAGSLGTQPILTSSPSTNNQLTALILQNAAPNVPSGQLGLGTTTATTATGGSETLPSNPVGFLEINIGGTVYKIPYYAA